MDSRPIHRHILLFSLHYFCRRMAPTIPPRARENFGARGFCLTQTALAFLGRTVFLAVILIIFGTLIGLASAALLAVVLSSSIADLPVLGFAIGFVVAMLPGLVLTLLTCAVAAAFPAAAIEDNEIGFSSAGELAKGNVWRIWFTFLVGLLVPLTVVQFVLDWLFLTAFPP